MTLFKTVCNTDWKYRATHTLSVLGVGTREELVKLQDEDVLQWQADDIAADREFVEEEAAATGIDKDQFQENSGVWKNGERWEMDRKPEELRVFCGGVEGNSWSIAYHIG